MDKTESSSDPAPNSEYHDSIMSDAGAIDPSSEDEISSLPASPERRIKSKSPTSTESNQSFKIESSEDTKADVMMIDAGATKPQYMSSKKMPNDPAMESATETWLSSGFGLKKTLQKPHDNYRSDTLKIHKMDTYDNPDSKKPSKV